MRRRWSARFRNCCLERGAEHVRPELPGRDGADHDHVAGEFGLERLHDGLDAFGTVRGEAPERRAGDDNSGGAEDERLEDVGAAAEAAINEHGDAALDGGDDGGKEGDGGERRSVSGEDEAADSAGNGGFDVGGAEETLQDNGRAETGEGGPVDGLVGEEGDDGDGGSKGRLDL